MAHCVCGFSLLGPIPAAGDPDGFQNYPPGGPPNELNYGFPSDIGTPKNIGEEYRRNTPIAFYAYDVSFTDYFRSNGIYAVDQAFGIMNSLTNVNEYSSNLFEFPYNSTRINNIAEALFLRDLKSIALNLIIEESGLTEPDRFVWALRLRRLLPGASCPFYEYHVIKRNFDPATHGPSSYVNGTLYSYLIVEGCPTVSRADAFEFPVDPTAPQETSVAGLSIFNGYGRFFTGLTRDDVGGLRYLYDTNNYNTEASSSDSLLRYTNQFSQLLVTSNLATLVAQSLTNDPVALSNLYPGLVINGFTNFFTNVITTNFFAYFTNLPFQTGPATLVLGTNYTTNVGVRYIYRFGNVVTNTYYNRGFVTVNDTNIVQDPFRPAGFVITNVTSTTSNVNGFITGDYFLIPSNACGVQIIATQLVTVTTVTNTFVATNLPIITNINNRSFGRDVITYFTNHYFIIYPVICQTNSVSKRQGIGKITYVKTTYDSLIGEFYLPITNIYRLFALTNSQIITQTFQRVITAPDIIIAARDLDTSAALRPITSVNFNSSNAIPGLAGPGTIEPRIEFTFNKVGPLLVNFYNPGEFLDGLDEAHASTNFVWGSFDGSTNAPIIYPDEYNLNDLLGLIYLRVTTPAMPNGVVGEDYLAQLQAEGGSAPYTWDLAPTSPGLPDGLELDPTGGIFGVPTTEGTYDITVRVTEAGGRTSDAPVVITIAP